MLTGTKLFISEALRTYRHIGAVAPSSRYLAKRMVQVIPTGYDGVVIELGAGTGVFTRAILAQLGPKGRLVAFEENERLATFLKETIPDPRLVVLSAPAQTARRELKQRTITTSFVISGLPLGSLPPADRLTILETISGLLEPGGVYVQFQYFLASLAYIKKYFANVRIVGYEVRNIPPAFVYECRK